MANTRIAVPPLYGGVSRQADTIRHLNQGEEADNVLLSVKDGLSKRPGSEMIAAIADLLDDEQYRLHAIDRDELEKYLLVYGDSTIRAFALDGTEYNVIIDSVSQAYLDSGDAGPDDLRLRTIADYTLLLNRLVDAGFLTSDYYEVTLAHNDFDDMAAHTPASGTYHRCKAATPARPKGYWKYDPGQGTFPKYDGPEVSGDQGEPDGWDLNNGTPAAYNPAGFSIGFVRLAVALTAGAWDVSEMTLTQVGFFADYEYHAGDQIRLTGGTGIVTGWYTIAAKVDDDTVRLETSPKATDAADATTDYIGLYCEVTVDVSKLDLADMHELAWEYQKALQNAGAAHALVAWTDNGHRTGYMTITGPWRGSNSTILAPETNAAADYDATLTGRIFSKVGGEYTITAGTGSPASDTLDVLDRWTAQPAPLQEKAIPDKSKMPQQIVRQLLANLNYYDQLVEAAPYSYWRLGEQAQGASGTGDGLTGKYYDNSDLTNLKLTRIDSTINFLWAYSTPDALIGVNTFSVEWTGQVEALYAETYTFKIGSDNGVKLWVNDVLIIDDWNTFSIGNVAETFGPFDGGAGAQAGRTNSGTIALTAGQKYDIKIQYFEDTKYAGIQLEWSSASQAEEIVPQDYLYSVPDESTTADDEMDRQDGTYAGTPTLGVTGAIENDANTAVTFDGIDDLVNMSTVGSFGSQLSNGVTLECWFKTAATAEKTLMGIENAGDLRLYISAGKLYFLFKATNTWLVHTDDTFNDDAWHHVAAAWDADTNTCHVYVDGVDEALTIDTTPVAALTGFANFTGNFYVGANNDGGTDTPFDGELDEAAIYTRAISLSEAALHYLVGSGETGPVFFIDPIDWTARLTGDKDTNPLPSVIDEERPVRDLSFHRNRLFLGGDENLVASQASDFFNLFIEDADNIADADPIDAALTSSGDQVTIVNHIVPFRKALIIFTEVGQQFELNAPETLTPDTAAITPTTAYNAISVVRPAPLDTQMYFPAQKKGTTELREYFYSDSEASNTAADVSAHCAGYLPSDLKTVLACRNNEAVFMFKEDDSDLYVYRFYWEGEKKAMSSWAKHLCDSTERLVDIAVVGNDLYMLIENTDGFILTSLSIPQDTAPTGWAFLPHLDNRNILTGVHVGGTTTWTLPVEDDTVDTAVLGPDFGDDEGEVIALTKVSSTSYTALGDYSAGEAAVGRVFTMNYELSRPYVQAEDGSPVLDMALQLIKLVLNHRSTAQYTVRITQANRAARDYEFTPNDGSLIETEGNFTAIILGRARDTTISIRDTSPLPVNIAVAEFSCEYTHWSR